MYLIGGLYIVLVDFALCMIYNIFKLEFFIGK
nr:MAG TPA: hypothetical protein [Caudoviricetes sp.]